MIPPMREVSMSLQQDVEKILGKSKNFDYWDRALALGSLMNQDHSKQGACKQLIDRIRQHQGEIAKSSEESTMVVMGTSGWRDRIGVGFSFANVRRTIQAIIETLKTDTFLSQNGNSNFEEIKNQGILVFRDNRYLGEEFKQVAIEELTAAGIKVFDAGECPTGVGSAVLTSLKGAGSINFTPSHNPMDYQGLKFNPADGGPAPETITSIIEQEANRMMSSSVVDNSTKFAPTLVTKVDPKKIYLEFLLSKSIFNLDAIRSWIDDNKYDLKIVVDYMHGSARGFVEYLLGSNLVLALVDVGALVFLNTNDDFSFHGVKPEPNAANQKVLIDILKDSGRKYTLAVAMDPDADRIRFCDHQMDIDMNRFGAIAYQIQLNQNKKAGIVSTAPSSDFALEMAKQNQQDFFETAVGFKYFRPYLSEGKVSMAFEESDGISFGNHTLEKDALAGFIAALDSLVKTRQNISEQYTDLCQRYGYFYPEKAGVDVKGVTVEQWQDYKKRVVQILKHELFQEKDMIEIGGKDVQIAKIQTVDGLKLNFADRSWILLRPSGTEPKFRIYFEVVSENEIEDIDQKLEHYRQSGVRILEMARKRV